MRNIKLDDLFIAIGYGLAQWRGMATTQLQKVGFTKEEAQGSHFITEEKAQELFANILKGSSSKKQNVATVVLDDITCDDDYTITKMSKTAKAVSPKGKKNHMVVDLKAYLDSIGELENFNEYRAKTFA